jgi:hypothetical protein
MERFLCGVGGETVVNSLKKSTSPTKTPRQKKRPAVLLRCLIYWFDLLLSRKPWDFLYDFRSVRSVNRGEEVVEQCSGIEADLADLLPTSAMPRSWWGTFLQTLP